MWPTSYVNIQILDTRDPITVGSILSLDSELGTLWSSGHVQSRNYYFFLSLITSELPFYFYLFATPKRKHPCFIKIIKVVIAINMYWDRHSHLLVHLCLLLCYNSRARNLWQSSCGWLVKAVSQKSPNKPGCLPRQWVAVFSLIRGGGGGWGGESIAEDSIHTTQVTEYGEVELEPTWTLHPYILVPLEQEGTL